jgi:hypothetical protein
LRRPRRDVTLVETESLAELDAFAASFAASGPEASVVLAGGDGSYMAGVTALARALGDAPLPPVALAPGGTVCTVARNWGAGAGAGGGAAASVAYVERLLDSVARGDVRRRQRPTLRVSAGGQADRVGFIVGAGLVARFFEAYLEDGAGGLSSAARIVARVFVGSLAGSTFARSILEPAPCTVELDHAAAGFDRISLVCASVVRDVGLGLRLLYRAGEETDRFHAVASPLGPRALGPQLPLVLAGRPLVGPRLDALGRALTLRFPDGAGSYVLDGELFRSDEVDVTPGPPLEVLAPR